MTASNFYLRNLFLGLFLVLCAPLAYAQIPDSTQADDNEDYSQYGSSEESVRYCTQKVRMLSPTKLISLGYEGQLPFRMDLESVDQPSFGSEKKTVKYFGGLRWQANAPVISTNKLILNLGANYYESNMRFENQNQGEDIIHPALPLRSALTDGIRTMGIVATAFKPLDEKHFIILSVQGDANGNFGWNNFSKAFPSPTLTIAGLYGWKRNENTMLALGATQTWRGGERLYVPLLLYNKTFNDKWGLEILMPARAHVRRNFSTKSLLLAGYEIEGNSYRIFRNENQMELGNNRRADFLELRRSELKFRLAYEQQIVGFIWLSAQVGYRYNYKFNFSESRNSGRGEFAFTGNMGNPLYFGLSLNLVSP